MLKSKRISRLILRTYLCVLDANVSLVKTLVSKRPEVPVAYFRFRAMCRFIIIRLIRVTSHTYEQHISGFLSRPHNMPQPSDGDAKAVVTVYFIIIVFIITVYLFRQNINRGDHYYTIVQCTRAFRVGDIFNCRCQ